MQHEHQAATAKGPQPSNSSVSLACPLLVVPSFTGPRRSISRPQLCACRRPSATISGVRFVVGADFAKRRSFAVSPKRASVPAPPAAKPPASASGCTKTWPTAANGGGARNLKLQLGRSGAAAPGGGPAAAARPRRGLGAVMLRTSAVAASPPGAGGETHEQQLQLPQHQRGRGRRKRPCSSAGHLDAAREVNGVAPAEPCLVGHAAARAAVWPRG